MLGITSFCSRKPGTANPGNCVNPFIPNMGHLYWRLYMRQEYSPEVRKVNGSMHRGEITCRIDKKCKYR